MKLAVSSIAWVNEEEADIAAKLQELGVKYVELAPTKLWDDPTKSSTEERKRQVEFWQNHGIEVVAFQSMLFGRTDYNIFQTEEQRQKTSDFLIGFMGVAKDMGAGVMVFGSPKNRQKGNVSDAGAETIAKTFFNKLGDEATKNNTCFCIEPNPTDYECDFITNAQQGIDFIKSVNNPGLRLHLDIAGMTLAKDDVSQSIHSAADVLKHFHISAPFLGQVEDLPDVKYRDSAVALKDIDYQGFVSIEMRPGEAGENVSRIEKAVRFAQSVYAD